MKIDNQVRASVSDQVRGLMNDYRDRIETAYCDTDDLFKITFTASIKPNKEDYTKTDVEVKMRFVESVCEDKSKESVGGALGPLFDKERNEILFRDFSGFRRILMARHARHVAKVAEDFRDFYRRLHMGPVKSKSFSWISERIEMKEAA